MTREDALKHIYDMAEQTLDRHSYCYDDWPEAWEALATLLSEVYPEGNLFVTDVIIHAEKMGIRRSDL